MPRVKRGVPAHKKHKKVLDAVKGHKGAKSKLFRPAHESLMKSMKYAYRDRKARKRDFRRLWIVRINAAARLNGVSYSVLMNKFKQANINIDRKILSDLAVRDPDAFAQLIKETAVSEA